MPHSCSALAKEQRHGDDNSAEHQQGCHGFDHKEATIAIAPAMVLPSSGAVRELITGRFPIEEAPRLLTGRASGIKDVVAVEGRP
jgi:hypothetical protein